MGTKESQGQNPIPIFTLITARLKSRWFQKFHLQMAERMYYALMSAPIFHGKIKLHEGFIGWWCWQYSCFKNSERMHLMVECTAVTAYSTSEILTKTKTERCSLKRERESYEIKMKLLKGNSRKMLQQSGNCTKLRKNTTNKFVIQDSL